MKKIETEMCAAVKERREWSSGNTSVVVCQGDVYVHLHGHVIYCDYGEFTLAGHNTNLTRSRLRALGVDVRVKKGKPQYKGEVINENNWYSI